MSQPNPAARRLLTRCEAILARLSRRKCVSADESEDFRSWARVRLIEQEATLLAKFRGKSSLDTYLVTVVHNLLLDYRISKWGKYRPSAAAKRLGSVAMRLEMLLVREGLSFDEAAEVLRRNEGVSATVEELSAIAQKLPTRLPRRFEGEETLARVRGSERAEDRALRGEAATAASRVEEALDAALLTLSAEDRLILKLHVQDGFSVADVSRTLHLVQKPLYRRLGQLTDKLRRELEARGISREDVDQIGEWQDLDIDVDYHLTDELPPARPSKQERGR